MKVERDDRKRVDAVRRGDEHAFAALYAAYQKPIYRYALHMCGATAADDVVQETFLALLRQPATFDPSRGPLLAYLFGIARRHIMKSRTSGWFELPIDDEQAAAAAACDEPTVLEHLSRIETVAAVRTAIDSLPLVYREVIVLCELQELDYAAAAAIVECPIGTVRSRLHRARALLTSKLSSTQPTAKRVVVR
jgi:RNA polymerase sigma-70 factor (ECF subfamily)